MTLGILTNVSGLAAQRSLAESQKMMDTAMERRSSGQRINSALTMLVLQRPLCVWNLRFVAWTWL